MEWYYVEAGQRAGPVNETEFERLTGTGKVQPETLVWRPGMANWQPLRELQATLAPGAAPVSENPSTPAAPPQGLGSDVTCTHCGGTFPKENTIPYGTGFVCATCKPAFLQKLKEGAPNLIGMNYAG